LDDHHYASGPSWSPDGARIAFDIFDTQGSDDLWVMNADGTNPVDLTNDTGGAENFQPSWSPDGTKIAWAHFDGASVQIHVMNADGTDPVNITNDTNLSDAQPDWQPIPVVVPIPAPTPAPELVIAPMFTG